MVIRREKRSRRYLGSRRWGVGNIKNARGKGDRGGVGNAGARKHNFTHMTAKERHLLSKKGFTKWHGSELGEITLSRINAMAAQPGQVMEFRNCKVLSNGVLQRPVTIKAAGFSGKALEKIKAVGGTAVVIGAGEESAGGN